MKNNRAFVLGLDGVPYTFLDAEFKAGRMLHLAKLARENNYKRMNSVYPTVSSVAWTTYATGVNPAQHGIFGFIDRIANPFEITIPTAQDRKAPTLWQKLSQAGKRVIVINVPLTYPPEPVNGILISGFLCTDIEKVSYPAAISNTLSDTGYVIDVDAWLAREDKTKFMDKLREAMEGRFQTAFTLMESNEWDFFQLHIMETDRLLHFFWNDLEKHGEYYDRIMEFFAKLDDYIGDLESKLSQEDCLVILSDHGFCGVKADVQMNAWLEKQGLLKFDTKTEKKLPNYHKKTKCYSLIPGRFFINLKGREQNGAVKQKDYDKLREQLKQALLEFKDPDTGANVIDKVFFREEIYSGQYLDRAADLIAQPAYGYDLKAKVGDTEIFGRTAIDGMHTYDDAFLCARNIDMSTVNSIQEVGALLMNTAI